MRTVKFFLVLALLVCLMEPCLVVAQRGGIGAGIRYKREVEMKAGEPNTRIKRSLFSMFKEHELPQYPLEKRRRNLNK